MSQQTSSGSTTDEKNQKTIADYLGDVIAVESHIEAALDEQVSKTKDNSLVGPLVSEFHTMVRSQRDALKALQPEDGSTIGNPVKNVGSTLLGKAAGVIDMIRMDAIAKLLRDDYVAFNLAAISYTMLYTTATALGDQSGLAEVSKKHLTSYAEAVQKINRIMGEVVVNDLVKDDHNVQANAAASTRQMVDTAWKTAS